jgi:hypothetical protein
MRLGERVIKLNSLYIMLDNKNLFKNLWSYNASIAISDAVKKFNVITE